MLKMANQRSEISFFVSDPLPEVDLRVPSEMVIICIGTDRSTGDSLGPMVGTMLSRKGVPNVYGTLHDPIHALNLEERIEQIKAEHPNAFVLAIDACLGRFEHIGFIRFRPGSLAPGSGVEKKLPTVGDVHIVGVVNAGGFTEVVVLQNTRLSVVMDMAECIVEFIESLIA